MLKESLFPFVVSVLPLAAASRAAARGDGTKYVQSAASMQQSEQSGYRGISPTKRVERLAKQLNLTSDQQAKVQGILQQQQRSMQNLRQDFSLSQKDRNAKMMDMRSATNTQIRALLTADQQQKWEQMQKSHQRQGRGRNRDAGDHNADPQPLDQT